MDDAYKLFTHLLGPRSSQVHEASRSRAAWGSKRQVRGVESIRMSTKFEQLQGYTVYEYTFLDDLSFIQSPAAFYEAISVTGRPDYSLDEVVGAVRARFLAAGWEGDGNIGVIWLPPFVDAGVEDTWGTYIPVRDHVARV